MLILSEAVYCIVLLLAGYVSMLNYLSGNKLISLERSSFELNKSKAVYLLAGVIISVVLICLFNTLYHLNAISQFKLLALVLVILPAAAIDYKTQLIPNYLIVSALIIRLIFYVVEVIQSINEVWVTLKDNVIGAVVLGGFFLLLLIVFKGSVGMGDIKLFAVMGLYQGLWGGINSVFFSLLVSFILSVFLLVTKKRNRKDTIAFGPSILIGTVIAISLSGM